MAEQGANRFRAQAARLEASLGAPDAVARKAALKAEITELFRAVDREMADLASLKEEIRGLVARWKALDDATPGSTPAPEPAPTPTPAVPLAAPTRADHLNASSHIEKGWNLISAG
ncbi:MAG TPA: hypothetical protein VF178_05295, partial [Gemmatimonadaceae bacterium]